MGRGLDGFLFGAVVGGLCGFEGPRRGGSRRISGGHSAGETPLPIPNREVKPCSADGTWPSRAWESRSPPVLESSRPRGGSIRVKRGRARPAAPVLPDQGSPAGRSLVSAAPCCGEVPAWYRPVLARGPRRAGASGDDRVVGDAGARAWGRRAGGAARERGPHPASRTRRPYRRPSAPARGASACSGDVRSLRGTCVRETRVGVGRNAERSASGGSEGRDLALGLGSRLSRPATELARGPGGRHGDVACRATSPRIVRL
jgi:hypothetical protein